MPRAILVRKLVTVLTEESLYVGELAAPPAVVVDGAREVADRPGVECAIRASAFAPFRLPLEEIQPGHHKPVKATAEKNQRDGFH